MTNNTLRLRLDGKTYLQKSFPETGRSELYVLSDDATAKQVAVSGIGEFWFLGRVRRAASND